MPQIKERGLFIACLGFAIIIGSSFLDADVFEYGTSGRNIVKGGYPFLLGSAIALLGIYHWLMRKGE